MGPRGPIETASSKAGEQVGADFEPFTPAQVSKERDRHRWSDPDEERMEGTAVSRHATAPQTVIDRVAHPVMAVMTFTRMPVLVGSVISGMGLGRGGDGRVGVRVFERDDAGELSDHEQADQKRNETAKGPKPPHGLSLPLRPANLDDSRSSVNSPSGAVNRTFTRDARDVLPWAGSSSAASPARRS